MAHANISIFIPHMGCPNACSFCDQRTISKTVTAPTPDEAENTIRGAYEYMNGEKRGNTEIAFFGGSFTAIDREYMTALLERAEKYLAKEKSGGFRGIRISTRPDCIDEEILMLLKKYGVTAIELGAQSMSDKVLQLNSRGHTSEDVRRASRLIKEQGFELGLQMMTGLYKSTPEDDLRTGEEIINLRPRTVRVYPTVVLEGTRLAELYRQGEYQLYPFDTCTEICARLVRRFNEENITLIRLGLHASDGVAERAVAGYYHPALGEIVRSRIARDIITENMRQGENICETAKSGMSALTGHQRCNRIYFDENFSGQVVFRQNDSLPRGILRVNGKDCLFFK